jgi:hypothetical protein
VAEDLTRRDVRPSSRVEAPPLSESSPLLAEPRRFDEPRVFRARFAVAYLVLAVLTGVGLGAAYLILERPDAAPGAKWSSWKPTGRESSYPSQIADFVGNRYVLDSGSPMVFVLADSPQVQDVPIRNVAIRNDPADANDISIVKVDSDKSVMYTLCGGGGRCTIPEGTPTPQRRRLLQRQSLELALYTFRYADVDTVIATLPPTEVPESGQQSSGTALFFRRKDFSRELDRPLSRTLLADDRPGQEIVGIEAATIDRLTGRHLYNFVFTLAQEGSAIMVLTPVQ